MSKDSTMDILRRKYKYPEYVLLKEVSDAAGFNRSRSADYMAINLYPSRGLSISGIELKSFRSDWLSELKNPKKAENIFQYCDYFWLLTKDDTIAKIEEIPPTWGWMYIKNDKVFIKKDAPKLQPKDATRSFMCALLKRSFDKSDYIHKNDIEDRIALAIEQGKQSSIREIASSKSRYDSLVEKMAKFQEITGVDIANVREWELGDISKQFNVAKMTNVHELKKQLENYQIQFQKIINNISQGIEELNK